MNYRNFKFLALFLLCLSGCSLFKTTNIENTVTIGTQVWMTKNLDVDHYRNGDSIPEVRDSIQWLNLKTGAWCYYNNSDSLGKIYGKLYNWYAVNDLRGLAPAGWNVPNDSEWTILTTFLGGDSIAGGKLKETGTVHWWKWKPNTAGTNESGFSALPGGWRYGNDGGFRIIGFSGHWWTFTEINATYASGRGMETFGTFVNRDIGYKAYGFSVRCIKDK